MSAETSDGKLRIPIEIKTEDSQEIKELLNEIAEGESNLREIKPKTGRGDALFKGAVQPTADEGFGVFGRFGEGETLPTKLRDTKSAAPIEKQNAFKDLQSQVNTLEDQQADLVGVTTGIAQNFGLAGLLTGQGTAGRAKGAASDLSSIAGMSRAPVASIGGAVTGIASKAFLPLFLAGTVVESVKQITQVIQAPGGPFDIRFKRIIQDEISNATERNERAEIRQGIRLIRVSPYAGFRGVASTNAAAAVQRGQPQMLIDNEAEYKSKGG